MLAGKNTLIKADPFFKFFAAILFCFVEIRNYGNMICMNLISKAILYQGGFLLAVLTFKILIPISSNLPLNSLAVCNFFSCPLYGNQLTANFLSVTSLQEKASIQDSVFFRHSLIKSMEEYFALYGKNGTTGESYAPRRNECNLRIYIENGEFEKQAETAVVYYDESFLNQEDAQVIASQREPVNIEMARHYDKEKLARLAGFQVSAFCDDTQWTTKGEVFKAHPNSVCIYSETYLWPVPGEAIRKEVAVLSLPAPALDTPTQPHWDYYMDQGVLNVQKYRQEMGKLAQIAVRAAIDHKSKAFRGQGLKRLVFCRYGQGNFLNAVNDEKDRRAARLSFYDSLVSELQSHVKELEKVEIVLSSYDLVYNEEIENLFIRPLQKFGLHVGCINGDIKANARDHDLIYNAWDPHSAPGNGNDGDFSFDGQMGRSTAIGLTQNPFFNPLLLSKARYRPL